jgi:TonB family protein
MPVSVSTSLALHAAGVFLFMHMSQVSAKQRAAVINNVDFRIQVHKAPVPLPKIFQKPTAPPKIMDFLKLALPAVPKVALQQMQIKLPEAPKIKIAEAKLDDRGRKLELAKVEALDLNKQRLNLASVDEKIETHKTLDLAKAPMLEEVGTRRVKNLPQALKMEDERRQAVAMKTFEMAGIPTQGHAAAVTQMAAIQDAAGAAESHSALMDQIRSHLPTATAPLDRPLEVRQGTEGPPEIRKTFNLKLPPLEKPSGQAPPEEKKKAMEITGPLADRKLVSYQIPTLPDWAKQTFVVEADVALKFWVSPAGDVLADLTSVASTSGSGQLDRFAEDCISQWKFEPIASEQKQWGIITFRFVLE